MIVGLLVTLGNVVASERERVVEMGKTPINGFVLTRQGRSRSRAGHCQRYGPHQGATEFEAIEHLGCDVRAKEQIEGRIGKELRAQGQGPIGKAQAIENHPFDRFPWGDRLLVVGLETRVDQAHESSIIDDGGKQAQVI